jgi:Resolvase, N terminal domain
MRVFQNLVEDRVAQVLVPQPLTAAETQCDAYTSTRGGRRWRMRQKGLCYSLLARGGLRRSLGVLLGGVAFKVIDDPSIDTTSRTGKLIMGILALIAEFENDIRRERQQDGINKAKLKE